MENVQSFLMGRVSTSVGFLACFLQSYVQGGGGGYGKTDNPKVQ